jgi:hypothetical protein
MKRVLIIAALAASSAAAGELRATNGKDSVWLSDKPCTVEAVLAAVNPRFHSLLGQARAEIDGQPYKACWAIQGEMVHLLFDDGDQGAIPVSAFQRDGT